MKFYTKPRLGFSSKFRIAFDFIYHNLWVPIANLRVGDLLG